MIPTLSRRVVRLLFALAIAIPSVARADCLAPFWQQTSVADFAATSLAAADLDRDGKPDVAGLSATAAFVLRNDGTGTFAPPVNVYSGAPRSSLVAADFNGDQRIDLAFARESALIVLPGKGDGTFDAAIESAIGITPKDLTAARFDGDSALDLAAFDATAAKLVVFRNNGTGAFTELQTSTITPEATAMTAADLDVDGRMDAVIGYLNRNSFDVFYGRGNGMLDPAVTISGPIVTVALKAVDMDANGLPDLAVARFPGGVSVIRNLGGRSFGDPLSYNLFLPAPVTDLAAADLTGDDKLDLVTSISCGIRTSTGSGTGTLLRQWFADSPNCQPGSSLDGGVAVSDFDGDGRVDTVASILDRFAPKIVAFRNLCGSGVLSATTTTPTISVGQSVKIAIDVRSPATPTFTIPATGTASVREGQQVLATVPVLVQATATIAGLAAGEHTLVVDYSGDEQYEPLSKELVVRVTTATTTTILLAEPPATVYGYGPKLTATVTSSTGDTPGGTFKITIDGQQFGTETNAPQATVFGYATTGVHTVVAEYSGDATHPPSYAAMTYVVDRQTPKIEVTPAFAVEGTAVNDLAIGIIKAAGDQWPKGTLTLYLDGTRIGAKSTEDWPYQHFALPALPAGRHALRVTFSGDANYKPVDTLVPFRAFPAGELTIDARGTEEGVAVSWHAPNHLIIRRMLPNKTVVGGSCCPLPPWLDSFPAPETVYLYQMESHAGNSFSNIDAGMRFPFTDDPMLPQTRVTSTHMDEVVRATNILRAAAGLGPVSLPSTPPSTKRRRSARSGSGIPASHVPLLRTAINEARVKLGAYSFDFTASIAQGASLNASHLQELREAIR